MSHNHNLLVGYFMHQPQEREWLPLLLGIIFPQSSKGGRLTRRESRMAHNWSYFLPRFSNLHHICSENRHDFQTSISNVVVIQQKAFKGKWELVMR